MSLTMSAPRSGALGVIPPLFSMLIFVVGHGLLTTLLTLRMSAENVSTFAIGMISTAYFAGLVIGSFVNAKLIIRVGHIRAYAAYASMLASVAIMYGLVVEPYTWAFLRLLGGFATGGLLVVIESWMLVSSSSENRGKVMAVYMILFYASLASGQLLLKYIDPLTLIPFALAAIAASLSVVPLSLTRVPMPEMGEPHPLSMVELIRLTPAGVLSSFMSGMVLGVVYGLLPLFFTQSGYDLDWVANLMAVVIVGGMALQYPVGRASDRYDRRLTLTALAAALAILSSIMSLMSYGAGGSNATMALMIFLLGGVAFSIYPISLSHACDELQPEQVISANQGLLIAYSIGAMTGPLVEPAFVSMMGPKGIFTYFAAVSLALVGFLLWRRRVRTPVPLEEHQAYTLTTPNTPVMAEFDPRSDHEEITDEENSEEEQAA
ncbi:MFS transporter [Hahella sp. HN01]|nr:MFS transporter [Hahella sp. HN01]